MVPFDATGITGMMSPIKVTRKCTEHRAIFFDGMSNLIKVMEELDTDFYALTDGGKIAINDQAIEDTDKTDGSPAFSNLMLIIHDPIDGSFYVVSPGRWIVYDPDFGYSIMSPERFSKIYTTVTEE